MNRRDFLAALIAAPIATGLSACVASPNSHDATSAAPPTTTADRITIRLESYNYGTPGLGGKALQTMIDEFQARYPSITIEGKNTSPTPDGQMNMIVTERAAAIHRISPSSG